MTDSVNVFPPLWRLEDANGNPVDSGYLEFYAAGTTTPLTVYSDAELTTALGTTVYVDAGGCPVASQGSSTKVLIYAGTADFKVIAYDASDVAIGSFDNLPGALDTSTLGGSGGQAYSVVSKATTSWSVDGTSTEIVLYNANPSGGAQSAELPSAVTVGDGFKFGIRHDGLGSTNTVTYTTVGGETIRENSNVALPGGVLTGYGHTKWFLSDGAGWNVVDEVLPTVKTQIIVQERRTSPPASPVEGGFYIVSGTPAGTWDSSGFAANDLLQYVSGTYVQHVPTANCGWTAYVVAEGVNYQYTASSWDAWSNIFAPDTTYVKKAIFRYQKTSGTAGGTATYNAWQTYPIATFLNSSAGNVIANAILSDSTYKFTLPVGWYAINGQALFYFTGITQLRLYNVTTSTEVFAGTNHYVPTDGTYSSAPNALLTGVFEVTNAAHEYRIEYRCTRTQPTNGLGFAGSFGTEVYGTFEITSLASLAGPQGPIGNDGPAGSTGATGAAAPAPIDLTWSTTTSGDPGSGKILATNASLSLATQLNVSETDRLGNSIAGLIQSFDDGTSATKGTLTLIDLTTPANRAYFKVTGSVASLGTYDTVPVSFLSGVTSFTNGRNLAAFFVPAGDAGSMSGPVASTDGELALFNGTTGAALKRSNSLSGMALLTSGVVTAITANSLTEKTTPLAADYIWGYSTADTAQRKFAVNKVGVGIKSQFFGPQVFEVGTVTGKTAATALAAATSADTTIGSSLVRTNGYTFIGSGTVRTYVWFKWIPPKSWDGNAVTLRLHIDTALAPASTGVVIFGAAAMRMRDGVSYSAATTGTAVTASRTLSGNLTRYYYQLDNVSIGGATHVWPCDVQFEVFRDTADAADTNTNSVILRGVEVQYTASSNTDN